MYICIGNHRTAAMAIALGFLFRIVAPFYSETFEKFSRTARLYVIPLEYGAREKKSGMVSRITSVFSSPLFP